MRRRLRLVPPACTLLLALVGLVLMAGENKKTPPAKPLDLNSATAEQLTEVPGIGPSTAKSIVAFREKSGPFRRVEDLLAIRGITRQKLDRMRPYVTVASAPPAKP